MIFGVVIFSGVSISDAPTPFSATPTPSQKQGGRTTEPTNQRKQINPRRHLIVLITQKLPKVYDMDTLRQVYQILAKQIDREKQ